MYHRGRQPYRGPSRPPRSWSSRMGRGRGGTPFTQPAFESADSTTDQALRLRLQGQVLIGRALEMENLMFQGEINDLRERMAQYVQPDEGQPIAEPLHPGDSSRPRSLAERIEGAPRRSPTRAAGDNRGRTVIFREGVPLPPTVAVRPIDIHPRFLPLGNNFQEGGTGGPMFSRPQDWPDAVRENPSIRPRGVRQWGSQPVSLDDLNVYLSIGRIFYGGNRPPGRRDPVDQQRPWKALETAFFRGTVAIILEPGVFRSMNERFIPEQPYKQPFLAMVEDPHEIAPIDIVEHLTRSGITEPWFYRDTVRGYARSYLRDWARHQSRITPTTNLGRLFFILYPGDISHPEDRQFVEDATRGEETWEESSRLATPQDDSAELPMDDSTGGYLDDPVGTPMEEDEDVVPPLESVTPSTSEGTRRTMTPEDEKLDWGEEELYRPRPQS
ncbi:hypothetical protein BJ322DRAFT_1111423 [Thelephora terrestris]|uniref:Uncharacterized protein n=1 Tax=Thelephora terrestris TaxID=56493 RepID=A0A9P6L3S2_9AGAM|nr:hypothetical protein BJ322DRAFT_1111423 [Thelephora terrestris]